MLQGILDIINALPKIFGGAIVIGMVLLAISQWRADRKFNKKYKDKKLTYKP